MLKSPEHKETSARALKLLHTIEKDQAFDLFETLEQELRKTPIIDADAGTIGAAVEKSIAQSGLRLSDEQKAMARKAIREVFDRTGVATGERPWDWSDIYAEMKADALEQLSKDVTAMYAVKHQAETVDDLVATGMQLIEDRLVTYVEPGRAKRFEKYWADFKQREPKLWEKAAIQLDGAMTALTNREGIEGFNIKPTSRKPLELKLGKSSTDRIFIMGPEGNYPPVIVGFASVKANKTMQNRAVEEADEVINEIRRIRAKNEREAAKAKAK